MRSLMWVKERVRPKINVTENAVKENPLMAYRERGEAGVRQRGQYGIRRRGNEECEIRHGLRRAVEINGSLLYLTLQQSRDGMMG